jgi:hypothetical protein
LLRAAGGAAVALPLATHTVAATHSGTDSDGDGMVHTGGETPDREGDWNQIQNGRIYLYFKDGYESDVEQVNDYINYALGTVTDLIETNPDHEVEFYVVPGDEYEYSPWVMGTQTGASNGEFETVQFLLIAPSDHNELDDADEDEWYLHGIVHDLFQIPMYRVIYNTRGARNWRRSTPNWFVQGIANYVAVYGTPPEQNNYETRINRFINEEIRSGPPHIDELVERIENDELNEYTVGTVIVKFMVDEWSWETVRSTLHTPSESWNGTLRNVFGVTPQEFNILWLQYCNNEFGSEHSVTDSNATSTETDSPIREGTPIVEQHDTRNQSDPDTGLLMFGLGSITTLAGTAAGYIINDALNTDDDTETNDTDGE